MIARYPRMVWRNSRSVHDRFVTCDASSRISRDDRHVIPVRALRQPTRAIVLRFRRRHRVGTVCMYACEREYTPVLYLQAGAHTLAFVPPAFVVKARWHDAAVIDVRGEVPSRWLQKLISDVAGVSNIIPIDVEYRYIEIATVALNLHCSHRDWKLNLAIFDHLVHSSCVNVW